MTSNNHAVVMGDLNLVRCFSLGRVPYIPVATTNSTLILYSRGALRVVKITDPLQSLQTAKDDLITFAGDKQHRPVLFYSNDQQLLMVSSFRAELSQYFRFYLPDEKLVTACLDKKTFINLSEENNFPLPLTLDKAEITSAQSRDSIPYPCIIKPTTRFLWRVNGVDPQQKVILVENPSRLEEILATIDADKDFVIQQFIPGKDDLIYSYHAYHTEEGTCLGKYCGRKIRCNPVVNGYSSAVELVENNALLSLGDSMVKQLGLYGAIKIDFKLNPNDGKYYLLEINPRFNMWHYLGMKAGINLPRQAFLYLTGQPATHQSHYATKYKWVKFRIDFPSGYKYYKNKEITLIEWLASYFPNTIFDKFCWRDPLPGIMGFILFTRNRITALFGGKIRS
ncbi:MAG: ATP-grasp domain-containing protein [Gammaproteobacteria bacterium]|nr:ATP-grasp domain-containing protein [Gammaproteobacteria bacterium]